MTNTPKLKDDLAEGGYKNHAYMRSLCPGSFKLFPYIIDSLESQGGAILSSEAPAATFAKITAFDSEDGRRLPGLSGTINLGSSLNDPRADEAILEKIKSRN